MKLTRIFAIVITATLICAVPATAAPNIVVFIADDMGWGDVGYNGSDIRTPNIDQMAADGIRLERFYVYAVCSPTRAAMMTGRSSLRTGVQDPFNPWYENGLPVDEKLLPEYLGELGYRTVAIGKWHLGGNHPQFHPMKRGFDHFYGSLNGYLNHDTQAVFGRRDWQRDGKTVDDEGYATHLIADEAVRVIENHDAGRPLFLYVSFTAPHTPLQAPAETVESYAGIENTNRQTYAAMVTEMDTAIGQIMMAVDDSGMADNTLAMFFTDNGGILNAGASNGDFRSQKGFPYEGGIRVPAVMSWPGVLEPGTSVDGRITIMDLLPTFAGAIGADLDSLKPIDGRNVWPQLAAGEPIVAAPSVFLTQSPTGAARYAYFRDNYKLVVVENHDQGETRELFDIADDPAEQNDLSESHTDIMASMTSEFDAMDKRTSINLGERIPDRSAPGAPIALMPDTRPIIAAPYTDSGPVPYPEGNYPSGTD